MANEDFCTYEELRDFTNNFTDLSTVNIVAFIRTITKDQLIVVEKELITDMSLQLLDNSTYILDLCDSDSKAKSSIINHSDAESRVLNMLVFVKRCKILLEDSYLKNLQ